MEGVSKDLLSKAEHAVKHARAQLVLSHPFFGYLALRQQLVPTTDMPTLMTDSDTIFYNPDFIVNYCDGDIRMAAIAHEVMHAATLTTMRRAGRDHRLWNMASDHAINIILKDARFKIGDGWLCDEKRFAGLTADAIYNILAKEKAQESKSDDQDGTGEGKEGQGHQHEDGCGWVSEKDKRQLSSSEARAIESEMRTAVAQAAQAAKMQGRLPGALGRFVNQFINTQTDWRTILQHLAEKITYDDYSWMHPDPVYMQSGFTIPSLHKPTLGPAVLVIDTSGSISQRELNVFASEVSAVLAKAQPECVYILYVDTRVTKVEEYTPHDLPLNLKAKGGGGTRFTPAFNWVKQRGIQPSALIYFTDLCCTDYPSVAPDYPVIWATMDNGVNNKVPFGDKIDVTI